VVVAEKSAWRKPPPRLVPPPNPPLGAVYALHANVPSVRMASRFSRPSPDCTTCRRTARVITASLTDVQAVHGPVLGAGSDLEHTFESPT